MRGGAVNDRQCDESTSVEAAVSAPLSIPDLNFESVELVLRLGDHSYYKATVAPERRTVTITVVTALPSSHALARMERERTLLSQLGSHPNISRVTAIGELADLSTYVVTEPLTGGPLALDVAQGPIDWRDAADIGIRIAGALATAHHAGILHRAVSPSTIMSRHTGEPMLSEFGMPTGEPGPWSSPDIRRGLPCRLADDVYSLAATVLTLLTGAPPSESALELATALSTLGDCDVPDVMIDALATTIRGSAEDRSTAEDLGRAFQEALQISGEPVTPLLIDTEIVRRSRPSERTPTIPANGVGLSESADLAERLASTAGSALARHSRQRRRWLSRAR